MGFTVMLDVAAPPEAVHAFFADPALRPSWQSSLRRIDRLPGPAHGVGAQWYDVTLVGARPLMRVTEDEAGRVWAEQGDWRGLVATLRMSFAPRDTGRGPGTKITAQVETSTPGWRRPIGWGIAVVGPIAVRADLRAAARAIERRTDR